VKNHRLGIELPVWPADPNGWYLSYMNRLKFLVSMRFYYFGIYNYCLIEGKICKAYWK
jgi:hypothetical protein